MLDSQVHQINLVQIEVKMTDAIVFLGIQGSGKGTQAKLLAERTGFKHINIGDLLREQVSLKTSIGLRVSEIIQSGSLVSDELVFELIQASLNKDCSGIIFDGFPRTLAQAEHLVKHFRLARVYYLDLSEEQAIARMEGRRVCKECGRNYHLMYHPPQHEGICDDCGGVLITRADDSPDAIKKRIAAFFDETYALKKFFEKLGVLVQISAANSVSEVKTAIWADALLD
ncbi:MAG: nucleoside monophosphate kinase [Candidatus Cloacimonetes bacterium]|jgi:adenylate kinase|nr:nucleoside monophosphate kinase [Candidatus Cloacimonadota bacterium]MCK9332640.1 nucleoside monophosphate kinase [Candidatus Cloacimonadota bacterium]MDD2210902.1 nucleoside monophosphate kinase [Candidatus Cloacimonadota bacterium]MDD4232444.1 nucleoside monophosphate kinase [Candidatus Cloacimonadota bacterium]